VPVKDNYAELKKLKIDNAVPDAKKAIAINDFRLLAVRGYTIEVPGIKESVSKIEKKFGIKIIEGTSDAFEGPEHKYLNEIARKYAEQYNQTIINYLNAHKK